MNKSKTAILLRELLSIGMWGRETEIISLIMHKNNVALGMEIG